MLKERIRTYLKANGYGWFDVLFPLTLLLLLALYLGPYWRPVKAVTAYTFNYAAGEVVTAYRNAPDTVNDRITDLLGVHPDLNKCILRNIDAPFLKDQTVKERVNLLDILCASEGRWIP